MKKFLTVLKAVGPILIATTIPGGELLAPIVVGAIAKAEQHGGTGEQKKARALDLVAAGVEGYNAVACATGHAPVNLTEILAVAGNAIDTTVGAVNLIKKNPDVIDGTPIQ